MERNESAFQFKDEREKRIYERLFLVGIGSAAFYRDACRILTIDPPLATTTHLVRHCMREIESALRAVLRPVTKYLQPPIVEETSSQKKKKKGQSQSQDNHQADIRMILQTLSIDETDPVAQIWLRLVLQKDDYGLHLAHRNNLAEPRPFDTGFLQQWRDMNLVFDRVLDAFEALYLTSHELIDRKLLSTASSLDEKMEFLVQHMPKNEVSLGYFFEKIGMLQAIEWLQPLRDAGFFTLPPPPEYDDEKKSTRLPPWPAMQYLIQIASVAPPEVMDILLALPQTENISVYEDCVSAASRMPVEIAQLLVPKVLDWLRNPYLRFLLDKVGDLITQLAEGGQDDAVLVLVRALLVIFPDVPSSFDRWKIQEILIALMPSLVPQLGVRLLVLFFAVTITDLASLETYNREWSSMWRPVIQAHDANELDVFSGRIHLVLTLAIKATELTIQLQIMSLRDVISLLDDHSDSVLRRLSLFLLSRFPDLAPDLVASQLTNRDSFNDMDLQKEYTLLLQAAFPDLMSSDQETILDWIEQGPTDLDIVKAHYEQAEGTTFTDELQTEYVQRWQRDQLARFGLALPVAWKERFLQAVESFGPAPATRGLWTLGATWVGNVSPKSAAELRAMRIRAFVHFLKTWQPSPPTSITEPTPSYQGLKAALKQAVVEDPGYFARNALHFRALPISYIETLLQSWLLAVKQHTPFPWIPVLGFCISIVRKRRRISKGKSRLIRYLPEWQEACRSVGELLEYGCHETVVPVALELRQQVWEVFSMLSDDPHPTSKEECPFLENDYDRATMPQATVRGMALFGVQAYASWVIRVLGQQPDEHVQSGLDLVPEAQATLEKHLDSAHDPSLTIHAWFGRQIPSLAELDGNWARQHFDEIFPLGEQEHAFRHAAWAAYCLFCNPYVPLLSLLEREYRYAIDELKESDLPRQAFSPDARLPEHIMQLYCWGIIRIDDSDGLLSYFFAHAPVALRLLVLEDIGHQLAHQEDPLSPTLQERLQAIWEWRCEVLEHATQRKRMELSAFQWWFNSMKFPNDWLLAQLERVLHLSVNMNDACSIVERLAPLSETYPFQAIQCFALLLDSTDDDWKPSTWYELVSTILRNAIACGLNDADQLARELIHRLGARGEDYRTLLTAHGER